MSSETSTNQSGIKIHSTEDRKDVNVNPKSSTFPYIKGTIFHVMKYCISLNILYIIFNLYTKKIRRIYVDQYNIVIVH